jgi:hypothetical protein
MSDGSTPEIDSCFTNLNQIFEKVAAGPQKPRKRARATQATPFARPAEIMAPASEPKSAQFHDKAPNPRRYLNQPDASTWPPAAARPREYIVIRLPKFDLAGTFNRWRGQFLIGMGAATGVVVFAAALMVAKERYSGADSAIAATVQKIEAVTTAAD